ncbi:MAG: hypothetical protein FWD73_05380 [Polyangiaceae bacterium]|nr:hypothetical protein [Polyangiaceae bacterium]
MSSESRTGSQSGDTSAPSERAPAPVEILSADDARRFFAHGVALGKSGSLCFEHNGVVRRVVLRDGDLVTASSDGKHESLVHFLAARGQLPREPIDELTSRLPPYGRHAGAALVAHGWISRDELWVVLRAHAEWIASVILGLPGGRAAFEVEPPAPIRAELSVFGTSKGPGVFVELVRRAVSSDEALEALGSESSRIADGLRAEMLAKCNIGDLELELLSQAHGKTVGDLLARTADGEIVSIVYALSLLGVLEIVHAPDSARRGRRQESASDAVLDEQAVRARVRARLELVDEGDYFAVLGIMRSATSYEVRRAFLELRRAFEPSRILTPRLHDLDSDVRKITLVLEEAYEILKDAGRRERYRRAIEAHPR